MSRKPLRDLSKPWKQHKLKQFRLQNENDIRGNDQQDQHPRVLHHEQREHVCGRAMDIAEVDFQPLAENNEDIPMEIVDHMRVNPEINAEMIPGNIDVNNEATNNVEGHNVENSDSESSRDSDGNESIRGAAHGYQNENRARGPEENVDEEILEERENDAAVEYDSGESSASDNEESGNDEDQENDAYGMRFPNDEDWQDHRLLYRGAPITIGQSMLLILALMLHHNLSMSCIADIITVINLHCLQDGLKKNCLPAFQRYFSMDQSNIKKHYYCSKCLRMLVSDADRCPSCPNRKNAYFIGLPFIEQLKTMYLRQGFYDRLQWRFQRPMNPAGNISDIYDGLLYQEWMDNGFLADPNNISFSWYTDGIPVYKSSKIGAWPIYLSINELPFAERKKIENTLLVGLWFGDGKPNANTFVDEFRPQFEKIFGGVEVHTDDGNRINVRGVLLMGTCDLPAKALFLNFNQFNGAYGCPACYCPGESVPLQPAGHVHAYRYQPLPQMRTRDETTMYADTVQPGEHEKGVKGPTAFSNIMPDFIRGLAIDRMHGIEGGMVKKILHLLLSDKFSTSPFSLSAMKNMINLRLKSIKPPKFVHRMPRSVDDLLHWKASELKMWFFHYSIPVLQGVMRDDYFQHYLLLVAGIFLLNADTITPQMIHAARDFLHKFVREFQNLYGLRFCSLNVHQLLHLPDIVLNLGPLWAYSCFQYEDLNGKFLKLVHGTWHLDTQIAKKHEQIISMVRFIERLPEGEIRNFCSSRKRQVKLNERIAPGTYSVGQYKQLFELPVIISTALLNGGYHQHGPVRQYLRLLKNNKLYISSEYPRTLQTESYVVKYRDLDGNFSLGAIHSFIKLLPHCDCLRNCDCQASHLAIIRTIVTDNVFSARGDDYIFATGQLLRQCHMNDEVTAIAISYLDTVCIQMKIDAQLYVGIPPNEHDLE